MANKFIQQGNSLDYTPPADVAAGTVVEIGTAYVGIAGNDIPANVKGGFAVSGVIEMPLTATMQGSAYGQGTLIAIDVSGQELIPAGTGDRDVPLAAPVLTTDVVARVQLNNGI